MLRQESARQDITMMIGKEYEKISKDKKEKLSLYKELLLQRNKEINLTSITDEEEFKAKNLMDSLSPALLAEQGEGELSNIFAEANNAIDVGTGGGFPGIPLAIYYEKKEFVLLDALAKRLAVIDDLAKACGIENVETIHGRAEDIGRKESFREGFDLCVSRAVAPLPVLIELCLPFLKEGGTFLAYKGADAAKELEKAKKAILELGGDRRATIISAPTREGENHKLILIKKTAKTPEKYPRRAGTPAKRPIL